MGSRGNGRALIATVTGGRRLRRGQVNRSWPRLRLVFPETRVSATKRLPAGCRSSFSPHAAKDVLVPIPSLDAVVQASDRVFLIAKSPDR
jgi:hypothetical protein